MPATNPQQSSNDHKISKCGTTSWKQGSQQLAAEQTRISQSKELEKNTRKPPAKRTRFKTILKLAYRPYQRWHLPGSQLAYRLHQRLHLPSATRCLIRSQQNKHQLSASRYTPRNLARSQWLQSPIPTNQWIEPTKHNKQSTLRRWKPVRLRPTLMRHHLVHLSHWLSSRVKA